MIELRKYNPNDYMEIQRRRFDSLTFLNFPDPMAMAITLGKGRAFTLTNGKPIICGGILPLWKGVGEAWIVTSDLVDQYKVTTARYVLKILNLLIEEMKLERIQTLVDVEHMVGQKWIEKMGFVNEGLQRKYIGGRDFYRYAIVRET